MAVVVHKYGGTSVGSIDKIKAVAKRVIKEKQAGNEVVVVVSAMGKTTDRLVSMAKEISENPSKRDLDMLLSTGEQVTISLLSMVFQEYGYNAISLTGFQAGIKTQGLHTKNKICDIETEKINKYLEEGTIVVVAGFQGVNEDGDITTLGRGGSDTTAVALAAKLNCKCNIYTDVEGIYSVDPRVYKEAKKLDYISYEEMMEMASLGAGVMEARAVEIGCKFGVPIYVASSSSEVQGTLIKERDNSMEEKIITGLTISDKIIMITINNVEFKSNNIAMIFDKIAKANINVDMISQTAPLGGKINVSFTVGQDDLISIREIMESVKSEIKNIEINEEVNITKVSLVGIGMTNQSGVTAKVFNVFAKNEVEFKQVTTSEISISFAIDSKDKEKAVTVLSKEFKL